MFINLEMSYQFSQKSCQKVKMSRRGHHSITYD